MSQIQWLADHDEWGKILVVTGWDRIEQGFHWTVFDSNMDPVADENFQFLARPEQVVDALESIGVEMPRRLLMTLVHHEEHDMGNRIVVLSTTRDA